MATTTETIKEQLGRIIQDAEQLSESSQIGVFALEAGEHQEALKSLASCIATAINLFVRLQIMQAGILSELCVVVQSKKDDEQPTADSKIGATTGKW